MRLHPPAVADRWSRFAVPSVWFEGISRFVGESGGSKLWETVVDTISGFLTHHHSLDCRRKRFSTLKHAFVCREWPFLSALGPATCLQAVAPTFASRRDSLPPLNASGVVQVPRPYSVSGKRASSCPGEGETGGCRPPEIAFS